MRTLERLIQSSMLSSRWINRHTTITTWDAEGVAHDDHIMVPDDEVVCDDCNLMISNYPDAPVYVRQYSDDGGRTWVDERALCSECAARYSLPVIVEEELLA